MHLIIDTETTGKCDFRGGLDAQPYLVQIGMLLFDNDRRLRGELNAIIRPEGWEIPDEAAAVHGITTGIALRYGVPVNEVLNIVERFGAHAEILSSFNWDFDRLVVDAALYRSGLLREGFNLKQDYVCTMREMTPICKIKKLGYIGPDPYKWPKLEEAYRFLFNEGFDGAHDAMADVRAAARIYFRLLDMKAETKVEAA